MKLFESGRIGNMVTRNRIVMCPMGTSGLLDLDQGFSRRLIDYYAARAKGGIGLIITGVVAVSTALEAGMSQTVNRLDDPRQVGRLNELCDAVHHRGAKLVIQLSPGFGRINFTQGNPLQPISASAVPCMWDPSVTTRQLTITEIEMLVKAYTIAAGMAKTAGVDGIEIHGYGGYLMDQFMTPLWNKRTDKYGGDLDGRLRFPMEIIGTTRAAVGKDFPLIYKFTADHGIEGGRKLEEGLKIAERLEKAGVDALHVSGGCYEIWHRTIPFMYEPQACWLHLSEAVKKVVNIPIIADGKLGSPQVAAKALQDRKTDFIGLGRPLIADPEWANKVRDGKLDDIKPCIGDNEGCLSRSVEKKYLSCSVNPAAGLEREYTLTPVEKCKHVLVVGGGPGGMEAARVAASRGHKVTLWEREARLGGKLIPASVPDFKQDIRPLIDYLSTQVWKLGVKVESMKEATLELILDAKPDVVIIATGASPLVPEVPGIGAENVASALDVLLGKKETGSTVVVVGGGLVGCETAAYLARKGGKVTVVEMMGQLVPEGMSANGMMGLMELVEKSKVKVMLNTRLLEVGKDCAIVNAGGSRRELKADSIVMALGFKPQSVLHDALAGKVPELYAVGDCVQPRNIMHAMWEGFHTSRLI
ncbi:MAG: FAD-dependent oxidoreductase [Dehalococcoidia bacterium]|nr:FAD-dependent oxidoreductase [Dehalococcoidia bacterium]